MLFLLVRKLRSERWPKVTKLGQGGAEIQTQAACPPLNYHVLRESPALSVSQNYRGPSLRHSDSPQLWQERYLGWDRGRVVLKEETLETVNPQSLLFLVLGLAVGGGGWEVSCEVHKLEGTLPTQPILLTWSRCLCLGMVKSATLNPRGSRGLSLTLRLQH